MRKFPSNFRFLGPFFAKFRANFLNFDQKLPSRDRKMRAINLGILAKNSGEKTEKILKKIAEI